MIQEGLPPSNELITTQPPAFPPVSHASLQLPGLTLPFFLSLETLEPKLNLRLNPRLPGMMFENRLDLILDALAFVFSPEGCAGDL